ncbi:MAG: acyltransferase [Rhodospirillales bacterium]
MKVRAQKIEQLESLRGLAALIVFFSHFMLAFAPQRHGYIPGAIEGSNLMETPLFFLINGTASVSLFFVLSGFVLSLGFFQKPERPIISAALRRWPRLLPIALASTVLSFALYKCGLYYYKEASEITHSEWMSKFAYAPQQLSEANTFIEAVTQGAFLTFFRSSADSWLNTSLWTMHLELIGSFIVFGATAVVRNARPLEAMVVFALIGVAAFFGNVYLPLFIAGNCLAYLHSRYPFNRVPVPKAVSFSCIIVALLVFSYMDPGKGIYKVTAKLGPFEVYLRVFAHGVASLALIYIALIDKNVQKILSIRPLYFLGRVSFPLYALHVPLIFSFSAGLFLYWGKRYGYESAVIATLVATLLILLPLSFVFAALDQRWCAFLRSRATADFAGSAVVDMPKS